MDDDEDDTHDRHARYYTELAESGEQKIVDSDQVECLAALRADVPNFRATVEWSFATGQYELGIRLAGALGWFWTLEGMLGEATEYLERAVTQTEVARLWSAPRRCGVSGSWPPRCAAWSGPVERAPRAPLWLAPRATRWVGPAG